MNVEMYRNSTLSFLNNLHEIMEYGRTVVVRSAATKEILNKTIVITNPRERCYLVPKRHGNVFAQVAETLWMLAGRNDIEWLSYYLPRAKDFSDNGRTWRGAYGPRLRNWNGPDGRVDQLSNLLNLMRKDPMTRQAVASIWEPSEDMKPSKDIPCNNWIHFIQRVDPVPEVYLEADPDAPKTANTLHMNLAQRSSDCMWGYSGIDTFSWSALHDMMCYWTGFEMGQFTHFITSFHVYDRHWDQARAILGAWGKNIGNELSIYHHGVRAPKFETPFNNFDQKLRLVFEWEKKFRGKTNTLELLDTALAEGWDEFFEACIVMLYLYSALVEKETTDHIVDVLKFMPRVDFFYAALEYIARSRPEILDAFADGDGQLVKIFM